MSKPSSAAPPSSQSGAEGCETGRPARGWILLDLDGTLLDVAQRYHRLHCHLVLRHGGRPLDAETYWREKRERMPESVLLERAGLSARDIALAAALRAHRIEAPRYLRLDRPWPWTERLLAELAGRSPLVLVTLRHHPARLRRQLASLGLAGRFAHVVAGPGDGTVEAKAGLLRNAAIQVPPGSVLVGDTEVDVASGRALGLRTAALTAGGLRTAARLAEWSPDVLLEDLRQVPGWLDSLS